MYGTCTTCPAVKQGELDFPCTLRIIEHGMLQARISEVVCQPAPNTGVSVGAGAGTGDVGSPCHLTHKLPLDWIAVQILRIPS